MIQKFINIFKKKKTTVSLKQFANQVKAIAAKYDKNYWHVKAEMDGFGNTYFSGYVQNYWTKDFKTVEEVIKDLEYYCSPKNTNNKIIEVLV